MPAPQTAPVVAIRRDLPDLPPVLRRRRRRRRGRSRGRPAAPRPPRLAGRRRRVAVALLPVADGRLRLRRRRLLRRRPALRRPGRRSTALLAEAHARRDPHRGRPGAQPHLRPAPVVPGRSSSRDDPKRDWYVWRDGGGPDRPPNNWRGAFIEGGPAWTWDAATEQWYLHQFLPEQPDLNWDNPEVVEAMHDVMRFWLDRGVDGFRIDVVHCIGRDPAFPDDEPPWSELPHCVSNEHPSHPRAHPRPAPPGRRLRRRPGAHRRDGPAGHAVGRALLRRGRRAAPRLQLRRHARGVGRRRCGVAGSSGSTSSSALASAWPTWVLSNHDIPRHRTRLGGSEARARAAAVILLTQRGTPFLYAGEELGLEDAIVPPDRVVDPGGRDGCRAPIPWTVAALRTAGARRRGCRSRRRPRSGPWRRSGPTRARSCTSTGGCWQARRHSPALPLGDQELLDGARRRAGVAPDRARRGRAHGAREHGRRGGDLRRRRRGRGGQRRRRARARAFAGRLPADTAVILR